jgi:hypothetical protein
MPVKIDTNTSENFSCRVIHFDKNKTAIHGFNYISGAPEKLKTDSTGQIIRLQVNDTSKGEVKYIRICAKNIDENSIISVGVPID